MSDFECSFYSEDKVALDRLEEAINSHISKDWFYMENPEEKTDDSSRLTWGWSGVSDAVADRFDDGQVSFYGGGRWHGPYSTVKYLANKYKLDATYNDIEAGCYFYHKMVFEKGNCVLDEEYEYLSKESVAEYGAEYFSEQYDYAFEEPSENQDLFDKLIEVGVFTKEQIQENILENSTEPANETPHS